MAICLPRRDIRSAGARRSGHVEGDPQMRQTGLKFAVVPDVPPHAESYNITQDWFSNHIPAWGSILAQVRPRRLMEIGCYEGLATTYIIENCAVFGPLQIHCIDTWTGAVDLPPELMAGVEARFDENVALAISGAAAAVSLRKIKQRSALALAGHIATGEAPFDLIYIDGSHTAADVLIDAVLAFQLLRVGGVMIFDDYLWSMEPALSVDPLNMPKPAIDAFATVFMRKVRVLPGLPNSQCYVEKIAE
jgi:predicted O-methyltransferase YrrM